MKQPLFCGSLMGVQLHLAGRAQANSRCINPGKANVINHPQVITVPKKNGVKSIFMTKNTILSIPHGDVMVGLWQASNMTMRRNCGVAGGGDATAATGSSSPGRLSLRNAGGFDTWRGTSKARSCRKLQVSVAGSVLMFFSLHAARSCFLLMHFFRFFLIMVPTLGWFRKGNRIQTDDLGTTPFWETSEYVVPHFAAQFVSDGGCEMATHYTFQEWAEGCRRENL